MGILIRMSPQHLAKGVERGLEELDKVIVGLPVKPSLIGNVGFSIAGAVGALMAPSPYDEILAIWGGHHSTTLWDYLEAAVSPAARLGLGNPGRLSPGGPSYGATWGPYTYIPTTDQFVPTRPGLGVAVGTRLATRAVKAQVDVGPYAGGLVAPKFIPGALMPKFQLGS